MGQALNKDALVSEKDFLKHLREETRLVSRWFKNDQLERCNPPLIGAEVEAWLVDENYIPCPDNQRFLEAADHDSLDSEIAQFNFELNLDPVVLEKRCFSDLLARMKSLWGHCANTAKSHDQRALMIGMPPTLREGMLSPDTMTPSDRYKTLNDRVMGLREGRPLNYSFDGREELELVHDHLMLEGACTSLQTHMMLDPDRQARQFNAAIIASAPVLAASANSPFLFGRRLWEETRIPAFEQAIPMRHYRDRSGRGVSRVTFGTGYIRDSIMELFLDNLDGYPPLLPVIEDEPAEKLWHFKLQNGTIWRWNRPILDTNASGTPHIRLENRITPAGPTSQDMVANAAFLIGLIQHLSTQKDAPETRLDFETARSNFYACAKHGFGANITWLDGQSGNAQELVNGTLCKQAHDGLIEIGVDALEARIFIDIIRRRSKSGLNGAAWQRSWVNCHGRDFQGLTKAYLEHQDKGLPVHTWTV